LANLDRLLRADVSDYVGRDDGANIVQDNIAAYLAEMLDWIDLGAEPGHESFDSAIRHRASQGLTLSSLLHAYRLGAATIWDELARLADTDEIDKEALIAATPSIFAWMNTNSLRAHAVFREIDIRDARRNEQVRAAKHPSSTWARAMPHLVNAVDQRFCSEDWQALSTRRSFVKVARRVLSSFAASRQVSAASQSSA
jgi:hypothetical protein